MQTASMQDNPLCKQYKTHYTAPANANTRQHNQLPSHTSYGTRAPVMHLLCEAPA